MLAKQPRSALLQPPLRNHVLVLEDVQEATDIFMENGYTVTRITYAELMSSNGEHILARLIQGDFSMLWCQTPVDWYVKPRERRTDALYQRVAAWITRASNLRMVIALMGPPGPMLKQGNIQEAMAAASLQTMKMRLCNLGDKFDASSDQVDHIL